jgi:hypothetical protein
VKGYIVQEKGAKVNSAKVVASTNREKSRREEAKLMKSEFANYSRKGGGEGFNKFDHKFYKSKQPNVVDSFDIEASICPYGVFPIELARVTKVHVLV